MFDEFEQLQEENEKLALFEEIALGAEGPYADRRRDLLSDGEGRRGG